MTAQRIAGSEVCESTLWGPSNSGSTAILSNTRWKSPLGFRRTGREGGSLESAFARLTLSMRENQSVQKMWGKEGQRTGQKVGPIAPLRSRIGRALPTAVPPGLTQVRPPAARTWAHSERNIGSATSGCPHCLTDKVGRKNPNHLD